MGARERGPAIVSIIGRQGTGKTTLIEALIPILIARGLRVGTVKDAPHEGALDRPGSDSARHRAAGAERTLLRGARERALTWSSATSEAAKEEFDRLFFGFDLVLVEGLKRGPFPKIEVWRPGGEPPLARTLPSLAVVTEGKAPLPEGVLRFSPQEPEALAELLVSLAKSR